MVVGGVRLTGKISYSWNISTLAPLTCNDGRSSRPQRPLHHVPHPPSEIDGQQARTRMSFLENAKHFIGKCLADLFHTGEVEHDSLEPFKTQGEALGLR